MVFQCIPHAWDERETHEGRKFISIPHTRGDERERGQNLLQRLYSPHAWDEPQLRPTKPSMTRVFPTRVGMNRDTAVQEVQKKYSHTRGEELRMG